MKLKAEIQELYGKYYGTVIVFTSDDADLFWQDMTIKQQNYYDPSDRQLIEWNITREYWDSLHDRLEVADSMHYETKDDYEIAVYICEAINTFKKPNT